MSISYKPLWLLLVKKNMKKTDLISLGGLTSNTIANMGKGEYISLRNLEKICRVLDCTPNDAIEFIKDEKRDTSDI